MKLVKVEQKTIAENWEKFIGGIKGNLPPHVMETEEQIKYIYNALMLDRMHIWLLLNEKEPHAMIITSFTGEIGIEQRNLLIYLFVKMKDMNDNDYQEGMKTLEHFAIKHDCKLILAYTNIPKIVEISNNLGFESKYVLLTKGV